MPFDVQQVNFLLKYLAEIIVGLIIVLLSLLKFLGQRAQAEAAKVGLSTGPVTQVELLEHQMEITTLIRAEFDKFRSEIREELNIIHRRVDELKTNASSK